MAKNSKKKSDFRTVPTKRLKHRVVNRLSAATLAISGLLISSFCLAKPSKILSATLASDEMLTAILSASCEPRPCKEALNRLVAVSRFADDKRYSNIIDLVSGIKARFYGDIEQVVGLKPDLVILASFSRPETISRLQNMNIDKFMMADLVSIEAIESTIVALGARIDEPAAATRVLEDMRAEMATATKPDAQIKSKLNVIHIYDDGTISGRNTLFDSIATAAGAHNAAHDLVNGWQKLSIEALIKLNPSVIVVGGSPDLSRDEEIKKLKSVPGVNKLSAWREGRIIIIPDPELAAVSPHITKAVAKLRRALKTHSNVTATEAQAE